MNNKYSLINYNVFFFRAFANECSGLFCNILHTIIIRPKTVFVTCLNLVLGHSAIYSLRHMFLTEQVTGSQHLSRLFHTNTLIAIYVPHVGKHVAALDTYGPVVPRDSLLTTSTRPRTFSAFDFQQRCLFLMVVNPWACDSSVGHQLMDCACKRRRGYHDTRWHRTDRNVRNDQVVPKLRPGWTIYSALLLMYLLLLPLEAKLSMSKGSSPIYVPASLQFLP